MQPDLRLCSWVGMGASSKLKIPDSVETRWGNHPEFGAAFQEWKRAALKKGVLGSDGLTGGSESLGASPEKGPPLKKIKTEIKTEVKQERENGIEGVPIADASEEMQAAFESACRVVIPAASGLILVFYNDSVYLYNNTDGICTLKKGTVVANFFRGKWLSGYTPLEHDQSAVVPFVLEGSNDTILLGTDMRSLGDVVESMRPIDPMKAKVAYHELCDKPSAEDMKAFALVLKHHHAWKSDAGTRPSSTNLLVQACAGWVPYKQWNNGLTALTWSSKWTVKGLTPIRPVVVSKHSIVFKARQFHKLEMNAQVAAAVSPQAALSSEVADSQAESQTAASG